MRCGAREGRTPLLVESQLLWVFLRVRYFTEFSFIYMYIYLYIYVYIHVFKDELKAFSHAAIVPDLDLSVLNTYTHMFYFILN